MFHKLFQASSNHGFNLQQSLMFALLMTLLALANWVHGQSITVVTVVGTGSSTPYINGAATSATLDYPKGIAIDSQSNMYIGDTGTPRLRKLTPLGVVSTVAGGGTLINGYGTYTHFYAAAGLTVDPSDNVFAAEGMHRIRRIQPNGYVESFAGIGGVNALTDGWGTYARFNSPYGITSDTSGNVYVGDLGNVKIRKITPAGYVSTLAGTGYTYPSDPVFDSKGNMFVTDSTAGKIWKVAVGTTTPVNFAGKGSAGYTDAQGSLAAFKGQYGITADEDDTLYVAEQGNHRVRAISPTGLVSTIAGVGTSATFINGAGTVATFKDPYGIVSDKKGSLYVTDSGYHRVRRIIMCKAGATFNSTTVSCMCASGFKMEQNRTCTACPDGYQSDQTRTNCVLVAAIAGNAVSTTSDSSSTSTTVIVASYSTTVTTIPAAEATSSSAVSPLNTSSVTFSATLSNAATTVTSSSVASVSSFVTSTTTVAAASSSSTSVIVSSAPTGSTFSTADTSSSTVASGSFSTAVTSSSTATTSSMAVGTSSAVTSNSLTTVSTTSENTAAATANTGTVVNGQTVTITNNVYVTVDQVATSTVSVTQTVSGSNAAFVCPSNSQCNSTTFQCLAGYRITDDLNGCTLCDIGLIKSSNGNQQICTQCPIGQESATNQTVCVDCQQGKYKPTEDFLQCVDCPIEGYCNATSFNPPQSAPQQQNESNASTSIESIIQLPMSTLILVASALGVGLVVGTVTTWICCSVRSSHRHQKRNQINPGSTMEYDTLSGMSSRSASVAQTPNFASDQNGVDERTVENGRLLTPGYTRKSARLQNDPQQTLR